MKTLNQFLGVAAVALTLSLGAGSAAAQDQQPARQGGGGGGGGPRNFDPEQMRQRMMERMREQLDVKDDGEWKLIEQRLTKVMEAQRDARGGMGMMFGRGPGGPGGPGGGQAGGRRGGMFGGEPLPEAEALQKAIDAKASSDEIKTKIAAYREARKAKEAALEQAQDELRKVLTVRQEAALVLTGMLK
ncbi:MAG TPA: hypothetical protein VHH73_12760 [Verrucomicrobiae bacterium]|nr:hypothetical protein [Verrucomicrobiae bacterium]